MGGEQKLNGPDLTQGVALKDVQEGTPLLGHAGGEAVLLSRVGGQLYAVGATCTHYSGPLAEGLVVGETVRCPWHHACFNLKTGEAVGAPALNALPCFSVDQTGDRVTVGAKVDRAAPAEVKGPASVVVVGTGAAGNAAAEMLRRHGYRGPVTMVGADESVPYDRPNLSKDYLAGNAPEEWIPLRTREWYAEQKIDLITGMEVKSVDVKAHTVTLGDQRVLSYGALILATGATPNRLSIPGADRIHTLRSLLDSRTLIEKSKTAKTAVVIGASFIGLEVAAALRTRNVAVHVVGAEARPLERVLGKELGDFVRALHEEHGVVFHLGTSPVSVDSAGVKLQDGSVLPADLVVAGIGVKPAVALAEAAGLKMDRGVVVDKHMQTSDPHVFAVGDIARWPDARSGSAMRVEHWVVAERQGQNAAANVLGKQVPFMDVPFFWSAHYDVTIAMVGHSEKPERIEVHGDLKARDATVVFREGGKIAAVATVQRDPVSLKAEAAMERGDDAALEKIVL